MPTATTVPQPQMGLTFQDVWAALMETGRKIDQIAEKNAEEQRKTDEQQRKTDEQMRKTDEQMRKTDEQMRKTDEQMRKTDERLDKLSKNVGGLNRSVGELIETLIAARLWEKFDTYSYNFRRAYQRIPLFDETDRRLTDIDVLLVNSEYVMAVEVKRELDSKEDVDHHLKRMELILKYTPDQCKGKKLLGSMAGGTVDPDVEAYAHSVGFFVLELTGESVRLAKPPEGFNPRQW
jgi:hypothetical protein